MAAAAADAPPDESAPSDPQAPEPEPAGLPKAVVTRRALLVAGGLAIGGVAIGVSHLLRPHAAQAPPAPIPSVTVPPAVSATPVPTPSPLPPLSDPVHFAAFAKLADPGVMQDFSYLPDSRTFFVTQKTNGSDGQAVPYETLIINRVDGSGTTLDSMTLVDGGHGLGIEAETQPDGSFVWITWQGKSADSAWRESDFVRLRYTPGVWTRGEAVQQLGLQVVVPADGVEAQYRFDWKNGWAIERHFDYGTTETFKRRRISDLRAGVLVPDDELDLMHLPVNPPTTQGFASIGDVAYRWCGLSTLGNVIDPVDPIMLQRWDWATGTLLAQQAFPTLSSTGAGWPGGKLEPEGMAMFREADGAASLLVGDVTGLPGHQYHVSEFARIAIS